MEPFQLAIALGPVAAYLLVLGTLNLRRRPVLTTGMRDMAALGIALAGLILVGPVELLMPENVLAALGPFAWLAVMGLYGSCVLMAVFASRPRLVVYNISPDRLRETLEAIAPALDPDAQWAGDSLALPRLGVQLRLEAFDALRNVSLVATGQRQSARGSRRFACKGGSTGSTWGSTDCEK